MENAGYSGAAEARPVNHTKLFRVSGRFAQREKLPVYFVGRIVGETRLAYKMYGRGTVATRTSGICSCCGRTLTHPVSMALGIGPECGGHWWNWDLIGGYTKENAERVRSYMENVVVDQWIPKACVIETHDTEESIVVPDTVKWTGRLERNRPPKENQTHIESAGRRTFARRAEFAGTYVKVFFPYSKEDVDRVRMLEDRRFVADEPKHWQCSFVFENVERLDEWGFMLDDSLKQFLEAKRTAKLTEDKEATETKFDPNVLRGDPFPFQIEGYEFVERKRGRALIADEMGLGKTIQALMYVAMHEKLRPVVIACPATGKLMWERAVQKWIRAKTKTVVLFGKDDSLEFDEKADIIIVNYDVLPAWVERLRALKPQVVIGDEIHFCKSNKAKRTKAMKMLVKGVKHVLLMSGTPALNRPVELYNALVMIDKGNVPDWDEFVHRYCQARRTRFGWDVSGADNLDELREKILKPIMIRRLKKDVLKDLPDKLYSIVPMEMTSTVEYAAALLDFRSWQEEMRRLKMQGDPRVLAEALVRIEKLKQICLKGKMPQVVEWIRDMLDSNGKLVVFTMHDLAVQMLMSEFSDCAVKVTGSVTGDDRRGAEDLFQENERVRLFVGNIKAAGHTITLTAASHVAFIELPWTPGDLDQASDRCHRIGQKDNVNVYYLVADGTIENRIAEILDSKRETLGKLIDGKTPEQGTMILELMDIIRGGK